MVDTSIPYKKIIMKLDSSDNIPRPAVLPENFYFRMYQDGDAAHWARIETSVGEFKKEEDALKYFSEEFLPHAAELKRRCVFICSPEGLPIATGTAWFFCNNSRIFSQLHWIAVSPEYQKKGLGKAAVQKVLAVFREISPDEDVLLRTQTWSHEAVRLYHRLGFRVMREDLFGLYMIGSTPSKSYDADAAMDILRDVYDPLLYQDIMERMR